MPFIDAQGLTYASAADRLVGRPEETGRNLNVRHYRSCGYREDAIRAYWQAFDAIGAPIGPSKLFADCHKAGIEAAKATGGFGPPHTHKGSLLRVATRAPLPPRSSPG